MSSRRILHWVFKIGNRRESIDFYKNILGMKVLRHEEFGKGCEAACNGPYDGKWSKTMIGYGKEDDHFVLELVYNYTVNSYSFGNNFQGITIQSSEALGRARAASLVAREAEEGGRPALVRSPMGYHFYIVDQPQPAERDPVMSLSLSVSSLEPSLVYWAERLEMKLLAKSAGTADLSYGEGQASLILKEIGEDVKQGTAGGRVAFSIPGANLPALESAMREANRVILTPLTTLETPGKAEVQVVILEDPDGHEICFVGDEGFRQLSAVDPEADRLLHQAMEEDQSDEWFKKKGLLKMKP